MTQKESEKYYSTLHNTINRCFAANHEMLWTQLHSQKHLLRRAKCPSYSRNLSQTPKRFPGSRYYRKPQVVLNIRIIKSVQQNKMAVS